MQIVEFHFLNPNKAQKPETFLSRDTPPLKSSFQENRPEFL